MSKEEIKNKEELEEDQQETNVSESDDTSTEDVKNGPNDKDETDNKNSEEDESVEESENEVTNDDDTRSNDLGEDDSKAVPYERFKEVNEKMKSLQAELEQLKGKSQAEPDNDEDEVDEIESNEDNSEADNSSSKLAEYEKVFNEMFEIKMNNVPEEFRDLIPEGDDLSKLKWIESATAKGLFDVKEVQDFGNKGNNPADIEQPNDSAFIRNLGRKF